jgi:hypothetical protein
MALAPHCNFEGSTLPLIVGEFKSESGALFEYAVRPDADKAIHDPEFTHIVYVGSGGIGGDCGYRAAKVLGTVAYIAVDEDDSGSVVEKWAIKSHRIYVRK